MSAEILTQIEEVLDNIRPALHADGGDVELVDFDDGFVHLKMHGACGGCPMSTATLIAGHRGRAAAADPRDRGRRHDVATGPRRPPAPAAGRREARRRAAGSMRHGRVGLAVGPTARRSLHRGARI